MFDDDDWHIVWCGFGLVDVQMSEGLGVGKATGSRRKKYARQERELDGDCLNFSLIYCSCTGVKCEQSFNLLF
jgi:hypothetical protein